NSLYLSLGRLFAPGGLCGKQLVLHVSQGDSHFQWETPGKRISSRPFHWAPRLVSMRRATSSSRIPQATQLTGAANDQGNARSYSRSKQRLASICAISAIPASRVDKRST